MKTYLITTFFALSLLCFSQKVIKNVGDFNELKVFDLIELTLIKSDKNKIEIWGEHAYDVEIVSKKGKLKIRMKLDKSYQGENTKATLYYTNLTVIDVNEGARVFVQDKVKQNFLELKAQEGAEIKADIKVSNLKIQAYSGGRILADGNAKNQDVNINTGGIYMAKDLKTERTKVKVQAAGEAKVYAKNTVKARVNAGGNIYIFGDPENVDQNTTFGGNIFIE